MILLSGTGLTYTINNKLIVIHKLNETEAVFINQQTNKVSGKVIDSSGASIPGVSVVVKGTTNGSITNVDGGYSIANVPTSGVLVFSFVGMKSLK